MGTGRTTIVGMTDQLSSSSFLDRVTRNLTPRNEVRYVYRHMTTEDKIKHIKEAYNLKHGKGKRKHKRKKKKR